MSRDLAYYKGLITHQYRMSTKFMQWLEANLQLFSDAAGVADDLIAAFGLDTAVGAQLDILGDILGVGRTVSFSPSGGVSPVLDDDTYRVVLKAKIVKNHWDGQIGSLVRAWQLLFPDGQILVTDNEDMSMDVLVAGNLTTLIQELIEHGYIVPKPEGVKINYVFGTLPAFGYDLETGYVAGYETGHWFEYV